MCPSFTREEFRNIKIRKAENLRFLQNIILFIICSVSFRFSFRSAKRIERMARIRERFEVRATITINLIDRPLNVHQLVPETRLTSPFHVPPRGMEKHLVRREIKSRSRESHIFSSTTFPTLYQFPVYGKYFHWKS